MKKRIFLLGLIFALTAKTYAIPAYPFPIQVTQPDGTVLTIKKVGDEWFNYVTTEDGYLIVENSDGFYEYAKFEANEIIPTGVVVRSDRSDEEKAFLRKLGKDVISRKAELSIRSARKQAMGHTGHQKAPNPLFGQKRGLVILVEFQDQSFRAENNRQAFDDLLNKPGYNYRPSAAYPAATGSANEYFKASTHNQFDPIFDVVGPYKLSGNMADYGTRSTRSNDSNPRGMVTEACQLAENAGVDFSQYDTDNNNEVDMVFIYYAGMNEAEGGPSYTIWPHKSELVYPYPSYDGKRIRIYACTSELNGSGNRCGIGTFCHEFGHVLGLPDFYNTETSGAFTIGSWDIMTSGGYNNGGNTPPSWLAYERFYLGYITPTLLNVDGGKVLAPIQTSNAAYVLSPPSDQHNLNGASPSPNYFYMLENRQYLGWDTVYRASDGLLGKGMLITKVNYDRTAWENNTPNNDPTNLRYDVIEADGVIRSYTGDTYPGTSNITRFTPLLSSGAEYDGVVVNIQEIGTDITFCYRECEDAEKVTLTAAKTDFLTIIGDEPDQTTIGVVGEKLTNNLVLSFTGTNAALFQMKKASDTDWVQSLTLTPLASDSSVNEQIYVRYNPTEPSGNVVHTANFYARVVNSYTIKQVVLTATSKVKVKVVPPVMEEFTNIKNNGSTANWQVVPDGVGYYLSIYQKNSTFTEKETFSTFGTLASSGWGQTFYNTKDNKTSSEPEGVGVLFASDKDTIWSPYYPQPLTNITFWVRNEDARQDGLLVVEALNTDGVWENIASIEIKVTLTTRTYKYDLDVNKNYKRVRIYSKNLGGGITFDDYSATYSANMAVNRQFIAGATIDSLVVTGLRGGTTYYGKIQATDKDPQGKYENVTDFSNEVGFKTAGSSFTSDDPKALEISIDASQNIVVTLSDEDKQYDLFVYTADGRIVQRYYKGSYTGNTVEITGLPKGAHYFISLGANKSKGKYAKVYLNKTAVQ